MRKQVVFSLVSLISLALWTNTAQARLGIYAPAGTLDEKGMTVGAGLLVGSIGFAGNARYGISDQIDFSPKIGFFRENKTNFFQFGVDARYGILQMKEDAQADISLLGEFLLSNGGGSTEWIVGFGGQVGRSFPLDTSDMELAPYGGVLVGARHSGGQEVEIFGVTQETEGDTAFGATIPLGAQFLVIEEVGIYGEVDIFVDGGTTTVGSFGITYLYR